MDNLKYNKSYAPDPTAKKAIEAVDEMPVKVRDAVTIIKKFLAMSNMELAQRVQIRDKDTGRVWK